MSKVPWRRSNHIDAHLQILANYIRDYVFTVNILNLSGIVREGHYNCSIVDHFLIYPLST